ncbi:MAG: ATP-binding cassette domain-containing protein, partial [Pirellulales bacterium]
MSNSNVTAVSAAPAVRESILPRRRKAAAVAAQPRREKSPASGDAQLAARGLYKSYRKGANEIKVLEGVDLEVYAGESLAIIGSSGSGKSTLLHLLGTLDRPDRGEILLAGQRIDNISARRRDRLR